MVCLAKHLLISTAFLRIRPQRTIVLCILRMVPWACKSLRKVYVTGTLLSCLREVRTIWRLKENTRLRLITRVIRKSSDVTVLN